MKVFVYGTLRQGGRFNALLSRSQFEGTAFLPEYDLYNLGGDVPGIVPGEGTVKGEVYDIDEMVLRHLRMLEAGYIETSVVVLCEGDETETIAYVWPAADLSYVGSEKPTLVPSGDWMER